MTGAISVSRYDQTVPLDHEGEIGEEYRPAKRRSSWRRRSEPCPKSRTFVAKLQADMQPRTRTRHVQSRRQPGAAPAPPDFWKSRAKPPSICAGRHAGSPSSRHSGVLNLWVAPIEAVETAHPVTAVTDRNLGPGHRQYDIQQAYRVLPRARRRRELAHWRSASESGDVHAR